MARILIVEDNLDLRNFLSVILLMNNYKVRSTASKSGLDMQLHAFDPDIILLDVLLGEDDGRSLCKEIKAVNKTVSIILISANPLLLDKYEAYGAAGVIEKPFKR